MTINDIFHYMDVNVITISGLYLAVYITIYFGLIVNVGDLKEIRRRAIYNLCASCNKSFEIVDVIDFLDRKNKVLVAPPERSYNPFRFALGAFFIVTILTIFYDTLALLIKIPDKSYAYYLYTATFAIATLLLYYETKFFKAYHDLQKLYSKDISGMGDIILNTPQKNKKNINNKNG